MSNMAKLRNWHRNHATGQLHGDIYCDPRWPEGTFVNTTPVVTQDRMGDALVACTLNTHYELVHPDGAEWFTKVAAEQPADSSDPIH